MSDMEEVKKENDSQRDAMDGGFAVVDRERIIEEETKEVKPWFKYFIEAFTSPGKMMEECYGQEPYKGASYGIVGCILFMTVYLVLTFINPATKEKAIEGLRNAGIAENSLNSTYSISMVSGLIGGVIGVFISVLLMAVLIQIIKAVLKNKASFGNIYKMLLVVYMVSAAVLVVDGIASYLIGVTGPIFQLSTLLGDISGMNLWLRALVSLASLSNIVLMIWLTIGYEAVTHSGMKKAVTAMIIYEVVSYFMAYGGLYFSQAMSGLTNGIGA